MLHLVTQFTKYSIITFIYCMLKELYARAGRDVAISSYVNRFYRPIGDCEKYC